MKLLLSAVTVIFMLTLLPKDVDAHSNTYDEMLSPAYDVAMVKRRVESMNSIVNVKFTPEVEQYIRAYLTAGKKSSELILGYGKVYFPVIEYTLQMQDLPEDLKYVAVIESNLRPHAISLVGAAGLWQLMPETAKTYGLNIDNYVDERKDPVKSTQVALNYLSLLHDRFGSWELALAAYNCGPGRLKRAIRHSGGSHDFWKLRPYLPKETSVYVSKFIAATYVMKHYFYHGLTPRLKDPGMINTSAVSVYEKMNFGQIEEITNVKYHLIRKLNSMYFNDVVPSSKEGHFVILPRYGAKKLSAHVNKRCNENLTGTLRVFTYTIKSGDSLSKIAKQFNCSVEDILDWNMLPSDMIFVNQKITIRYVIKNA